MELSEDSPAGWARATCGHGSHWGLRWGTGLGAGEEPAGKMEARDACGAELGRACARGAKKAPHT